MRIALVSVGNAEDVNVWSGIPHSILQELRQQADSVHVVSLNRDFRYLYAPAKLLHAVRKTQIQLDRHPLALRQYRYQIQRQLKGQRVDAILATSSIPITGLQLDIPILFWTDAVVDAMAEYYPAAFTGLTAKELKLCHWQEQQAMQSASCALYSSAWAVNSVKQHYEIDPGKLHVVEFGANLHAEMAKGQAEALTETRSHKRTIDLLWVGVDWKRKGGDIALEATRLLRERGLPATLHVVGCASPAAEHVRNYGFLNRASAEGRAALARLFQEATFFLFPTRAEAAGIVFAEACSFALPIIATDTGGVGTYVVEGQNGTLLAPDAPAAAYADAVERIWNDQALYQRLSTGAHQAFEQRLNWRASVAKALELARRYSSAS